MTSRTNKDFQRNLDKVYDLYEVDDLDDCASLCLSIIEDGSCPA